MVLSDNTGFKVTGVLQRKAGERSGREEEGLSPGLLDGREYSPYFRDLQGKSHSQGRARILLKSSLWKFY